MKMIFALFFLGFAGCATPIERFGSDVDTSETSQAAGDAYVTEAMSPRKWEPVREKNDDAFYFKNCEQLSDKTYYSATSYDCTEH